MKIALFGREIGKNNEKKFKIFIDAVIDKGADLCFYNEFYNNLPQTSLKSIKKTKLFSSAADLPEDVNLFLSLGGDGTFLTSLAFVRDRSIPVAGINFGRLGFLTTAKVEIGENKWIDDLLNGCFSIEKRALIKLKSPSVQKEFYPYAINEISIQRQDSVMLSIEVRINGMGLPQYWADGLVIATPTGSTAYSLSVGGPIVLPDSQVLIIAPIAPHNLNVRPLVVPIDSTLEVIVHSQKREAIVTMDNRSFVVASGEKMIISKGEYFFNYVSLFDSNFIGALNDKLLWGEDKRNNSKN
ncbi:MAG: NAD(+)/NADH kinase [Bacteroidales bacterium]|jgi:NAD+ kinase